MDKKILLEKKLYELDDYNFPDKLDNKMIKIINNKIDKKIRFLLFLKHMKSALLFLFVLSFVLVIYNIFSGDNFYIIKNIFIVKNSVYLLALYELINPYLIGLFLLFGLGYFVDKNIFYQKNGKEVLS